MTNTRLLGALALVAVGALVLLLSPWRRAPERSASDSEPLLRGGDADRRIRDLSAAVDGKWQAFTVQSALAQTSGEDYPPWPRTIPARPTPGSTVGNLEFCFGDTSEIHMLPRDSEIPHVLDTGLGKVHSFFVYHRASDDKLVLAVVGDAAGGSPLRGQVKFYVDSDGDGVIVSTDLTATVTDAPPPPGGSRWVSVCADTDGTGFVLDKRNARVLILTDTDGDDVPDDLATVAYLDSTQIHELANTQTILHERGCLYLHRDDPYLGLPSKANPAGYMRVRDTNGDNRADEYETL